MCIISSLYAGRVLILGVYSPKLKYSHVRCKEKDTKPVSTMAVHYSIRLRGNTN